LVGHADDGGRIEAAAQLAENGRLRLQADYYRFAEQRAKLLFVLALIAVVDLGIDRQAPEAADVGLLRRDAHGVAGRDGGDVFVWGAIGGRAVQQERADVVIVQLVDARFVDQRLQPARPDNAFRLHVVVKRTHAREVAGEDRRRGEAIADDEAPVADQAGESIDTPTLVRGEGESGVASVAIEEVAQKEAELAAIIEAAIEVRSATPHGAPAISAGRQASHTPRAHPPPPTHVRRTERGGTRSSGVRPRHGCAASAPCRSPVVDTARASSRSRWRAGRRRRWRAPAARRPGLRSPAAASIAAAPS